jgi:N-acetylmuramoyl-L-alanine amidase
VSYLIDIYLSPSGQEHNPCIRGDVEETHMNRICDEMIPYLEASGVTFARNTKAMSSWTSSLDSNKHKPRIHYAMHSNANSKNPKIHGQRCYYNPVRPGCWTAADTLVKWQQKIYYDPAGCRKCMPGIKYNELYAVRAPIAIIDEIGYHTNNSDMIWAHGEAREIAKNKVQALCQILGKKFVDPYAGSGGGGQPPIPPPAPTPIVHVYADGETLWSIGRHYNVPYETIKRKDGKPIDSGNMHVGDVLLIPVK